MKNISSQVSCEIEYIREKVHLWHTEIAFVRINLINSSKQIIILYKIGALKSIPE